LKAKKSRSDRAFVEKYRLVKVLPKTKKYQIKIGEKIFERKFAFEVAQEKNSD
jgi:hypothetical protein